jgi:hypothetical protein
VVHDELGEALQAFLDLRHVSRGLANVEDLGVGWESRT